jgi:phospholipase/carboxylesterase
VRPALVRKVCNEKVGTAKASTEMSAASPRALDASTVIEPTGGAHDSAIIFLHGSGDTGEGAKEWVTAATGGGFTFPNTRIVFPTAPMRKYSLLGPHGVQRVWFDRKFLDPTGPEDVEGTDAMRQQLRRVIDQEVARGVPLSRIVCGASDSLLAHAHTARTRRTPVASRPVAQ